MNLVTIVAERPKMVDSRNGRTEPMFTLIDSQYNFSTPAEAIVATGICGAFLAVELVETDTYGSSADPADVIHKADVADLNAVLRHSHVFARLQKRREPLSVKRSRLLRDLTSWAHFIDIKSSGPGRDNKSFFQDSTDSSLAAIVSGRHLEKEMVDIEERALVVGADMLKRFAEKGTSFITPFPARYSNTDTARYEVASDPLYPNNQAVKVYIAGEPQY